MDIKQLPGPALLEVLVALDKMNRAKRIYDPGLVNDPDPHKGGHYISSSRLAQKCSDPPCGGQAHELTFRELSQALIYDHTTVDTFAEKWFAFLTAQEPPLWT